MRAKTILASGALFLSLVGIGSAKTWDVIMDSATRAGQTMLPAGSYSVKLANNTQAIFRAADSGKTYTVPVKVEKEGQKYDQTAVETKTENGTQVIQSINLSGTPDKLEFGTE